MKLSASVLKSYFDTISYWFSLVVVVPYLTVTAFKKKNFSSLCWTQLVFPTFSSLIHDGLNLLRLSLVLLSVSHQRQVLRVCFWEHNGLMAGWQSHFIMCALTTRDLTMWNTGPPHPCTKPEWIILIRHQLTTLRRWTRHILAPLHHCRTQKTLEFL